MKDKITLTRGWIAKAQSDLNWKSIQTGPKGTAQRVLSLKFPGITAYADNPIIPLSAFLKFLIKTWE